MKQFDVTIVGAGAAGLFCAGVAGQLGLSVLLIDHSPKVAEKIRISGGGRANFTNKEVLPQNYISQNPHFCRSALARYSSADFIKLVSDHGIAFHEKHKGQLFCDHSANDLIQMLLAECDKGKVTRWQPCSINSISHDANSALYTLQTSQGPVTCPAVVIATGGLPVPKIGATDYGLKIAQQFGLRIVPTRPALVPLTFNPQEWAPFVALSGAALAVEISTGQKKNKTAFLEDLLFTHRGLSGPAVLQISSYWQAGTLIKINLVPQENLSQRLIESKQQSKKLIANEISQWLPSRLADTWTEQNPAWQKPVCDAQDKALLQLAEKLNQWELQPSGTEGYAKAEVMAGGVDTRDLSSQTMESTQKGLYFIGEVVDVTGWLGGYNFQWAWSSAFVCANSLKQQLQC